MKFTAKQYAQALYDSLEDTNPKDVDLVLNNFVEVLVQNNDIKTFDLIEEEFHKLELEKKGKRLAEVTTAHPISKETERDIIHELNKIVKGDVEVKKRIDERILGGVVIKLDDQLIDASVKGELNKLKDELSN
ncbi:MAG: ATP synthase F1 subunit delta [Candidatus Doudnabacteria bacterium]|nr:ATP synthase F1 subunit delta [Candidatus Doudnabacteria bacterium]